MYLTPWALDSDNEYFESILSLKEGLTPIFKLRIIQKWGKSVKLIVRDYSTGKLLSEVPLPPGDYNMVDLKRACIRNAYLLLTSEHSEICNKTQRLTCPSNDIKEQNYCNICSLPTLFS